MDTKASFIRVYGVINHEVLIKLHIQTTILIVLKSMALLGHNE